MRRIVGLGSWSVYIVAGKKGRQLVSLFCLERGVDYVKLRSREQR